MKAWIGLVEHLVFALDMVLLSDERTCGADIDTFTYALSAAVAFSAFCTSFLFQLIVYNFRYCGNCFLEITSYLKAVYLQAEAVLSEVRSRYS